MQNLDSVDALDESNPPLRLANPLSREWEFMRTSLRSNVLNTLSYNRRIAQGEGIRIFEVGRVYIPRMEAKERDLPEEREMLVGVVSGPRFGATWIAEDSEMGFFDAKGSLEYIFARLGISVKYEPFEDSVLQRGRTARLTAGGVSLGVVGEVQGRILEKFDLESHPVAMFEISMDALLAAAENVSLTYQGASRYPESYRDLAIVVDEDVTVSRIREIIERHALVVRSAPFDIYSGEGVEEGRKSVAFRVVFQSDRGTLTSDQVDRFQNDILRQLSRNLNAELRG